jgi:hypothetical protein
VLGRRLRVNTGPSPGPWLEVVGVAPDLPRTSVTPRSLIDAVRREIQTVDPSLPVWRGPYSLDDWHAAVLLGVAVVIVVTALAGCLLPALRASRIDPLIAIRLD